MTGEGIPALIERIEAEFARRLSEVELLVPYEEGGRLAELHELAGDLEREDTPDGVRVSGAAARQRRRPLRALRAVAHRPTDERCASCGWTRARRSPPEPTPATPASTSTRSRTRCSRPGERASVPTGIAVEIPPGQAGLVLPRSGLAARHGISVVNAPGLIDSGYRGEVRVLLLNTDREQPFELAAGDRIAQLVLVARRAAGAGRGRPRSATAERGAGGFGSSGG